MQLRELKRETAEQAKATKFFERSVYPTLTDFPVSELSVKAYGEKAWHTQKPTAEHPNGAPHTFQPFSPPEPRWQKKLWDVDHQQYVKEGLKAAHATARSLKSGESIFLDE